MIKKIAVIVLLSSNIFAQIPKNKSFEQWLSDFNLLVSLDISAREARYQNNVLQYINKKYSNDPFQKEIFKNIFFEMENAINTPFEDIDKHREVANKISKLYTCRDYILKKNNPGIDFYKLNKDKQFFEKKVLEKDRKYFYQKHKIAAASSSEGLGLENLEQQKKDCLELYKKITGK